MKKLWMTTITIFLMFLLAVSASAESYILKGRDLVVNEEQTETVCILKFGDDFVRIPIETTNSWCSQSDGKYKWTDSLVKDYLKKLAVFFDTKGNERRFRTHDGYVISLEGYICGWKMDIDATVEAIKNCVENNLIFATPVWENGYNYDSNTDFVDFYAEVDIKNQMVYLVKDGKEICESPCVSGDKNTHDTPVGIYTVEYKQSPSVLTGETYETDVEYWVCFNVDIGFHDAGWRSAFGGDLYTWNGSHGCVNLPVEAAKQMYENMFAGYPVIVYDLDKADIISMP